MFPRLQRKNLKKIPPLLILSGSLQQGEAMKKEAGKPLRSIPADHSNAEFMKIRGYVVDLILRAGPQPQPIPSARELARMFGVSHPTVLKAVRVLLNDGHLLARRRGGYLTVPGSFGSWGSPKIIGVLIGSGNYVLFDRSTLMRLNPFLEEIFWCSGSIYAQNIFCQGSPHEMAGVIANYHLDGIVWLDSRPEYFDVIRELRDSGLAVLEISAHPSGLVRGARWDYAQEYYLAIRQSLADGARHPLILSGDPGLEKYLDGVRRACMELDFPFERCIVLSGAPDGMIAQLRQLFAYGLRFDAVLFQGRDPELSALLAENILPADAHRIFRWEIDLSRDSGFSGCCITRQCGDLARRLAEEFTQHLQSGTRTEPLVENVPVRLVPYSNGLPRLP